MRVPGPPSRARPSTHSAPVRVLPQPRPPATSQVRHGRPSGRQAGGVCPRSAQCAHPSSASASATARVAQTGYHHLRGSSSAGQLANHIKPLSSASRYASREAPAAAPDPNQRKRDEEARKEEERKIREERAVNERMAEEVRARTEVLSHWPVEARSDSSLAFLQAPPAPSDTQDVARRPAMPSDDAGSRQLRANKLTPPRSLETTLFDRLEKMYGPGIKRLLNVQYRYTDSGVAPRELSR